MSTYFLSLTRRFTENPGEEHLPGVRCYHRFVNYLQDNLDNLTHLGKVGIVELFTFTSDQGEDDVRATMFGIRNNYPHKYHTMVESYTQPRDISDGGDRALRLAGTPLAVFTNLVNNLPPLDGIDTSAIVRERASQDAIVIPQMEGSKNAMCWTFLGEKNWHNSLRERGVLSN